MTTYVYETIPSKAGEKPRYFEIKQSIKDPTLIRHPETGEPIRRVVLGGFGVLKKDGSGAKSRSGSGSKSGSCGCGTAGCC